MYLLRTRDATLHHFNRSNEVKYAILSHRWKNPAEENSFVDIVSLAERCLRTGENPRDHVCDKIRECCLFAERAGYEWVWIDTCCIDHNSSAELSESINSMYAWYADADVCYAYLFDVGDDEDPTFPDSAFRRSEWFERGWTLQELIAPTREIFLSRTWHTLGSKHMLAHVVEDVTGVDRDILTHKRILDSVSVAQRMSWASRRHTSRVEDRAYSLLGIFGINIPTIYGEGERAFVRLQEEILRRIPDQTIFAWGPIHTDIKSAHAIMEQDQLGAEQRANDPRTTAFDTQARLQDLLAPSPAEFAHAAGLRSIPVKDLASRFRLQTMIPQYKLSSYGLQFSLPLSKYRIQSWKSWMARTGTATTQHVQIGLLACENADGDLIVLFLRRSNSPGAGTQYAVGEFIGGTETQHYHRGSVFSKDIFTASAHPVAGAGSKTTDDRASSRKGKTAEPQPFNYMQFTLRDIYIFHQDGLHVASYTRQDGTIREIMATRDYFTFTLPPWLLTMLANRHGLLPMRDAIDESAGVRLRVPFRPSKEQIARGYLASVSFADPILQEKVTLVLGVGGCLCLRALPLDGVPLHKLWVAVRIAPLSSEPGSYGPASVQGKQLQKLSGPTQTMPRCKKTHIDFTMVRSDDFMIKTVFGEGDEGTDRRVEVEFRKWEGFERIRPIMCQSHVVTFDLAGKVYERGPLPFPKVYSMDEVPQSLRQEVLKGLDESLAAACGGQSEDHDHSIAQVSTQSRTVRFSVPDAETQASTSEPPRNLSPNPHATSFSSHGKRTARRTLTMNHSHQATLKPALFQRVPPLSAAVALSTVACI